MKTKFKLAALLLGWLGAGSISFAEEGLLEAVFTPFRQKEIVPVDNKQYKEECGSCHFAYPPGLLPTKSWEKLLKGDALKNHFGDNAELDNDVQKVIYDYAMANAADKSYHKRARKIAIATEKIEAPLRITEVRYIKRKHQQLTDKMVKDNPGVKSLSYCDACHTQANQGVFDKDYVKVPNFSE